VVGIGADDRLDLVVGEEFVLAFAQVQHDLGAARGLVHGFQRVVAGALGFPAHAVLGREAGAAGGERDAVGDDEGGVEADAELADQRGVLLLVAGQLAEEFAGAGLGDGADVLDHFLPAHADAVVGDRERARLAVEGDADLEVGVVLEQRGVAQSLEAQLVGGVGGVGNQFAQENVLVGIQGMDHQLEELLDFGLEAEGFFGGGHAFISRYVQIRCRRDGGGGCGFQGLA
jgi:hypothetical protein